MICACMFPIAQLPGMFANVSANLAMTASVSASLSAAASASLSASLKASAQAKAAASAALSAKAMAKLTATATAVASVQAALRVDLLSSSAPAAMNQLFQSMQANNLAGALGQLPVGALAQLKAVAAVGAAAQAQSSTSASQNAAMAAAASSATSAAALMNTQAAVKQAFGANLTEAGSAAALVSAMATLNGNLAQMPNFGLLVSASLLGKASQLLDALQAVKANLGVDLTQKGAGAKLNQALSSAAQSVQSAGTTSGQAAKVQQSANLVDTSTVATSLIANNLQGFTASQVPQVPTQISLLAGLLGKLCGFGSDCVQHQPCGKQCLFALASLFSLFGCICPSASKSAGT